MATNFPASLDTFVNPAATDNLATVNHASQHDNINDAVAALEAKVGVNGSAVTTSLDYKVNHPFPAPAFLRSASAIATMDPTTLNNSFLTLTSSTLFLVFFTAPISITTTQVRYIVGSAATSVTSGSVGLYSIDASDNGTLVASVSSASAFTSANTVVTQSWAASTAITAGSRYAVGFLSVVTGTVPTLAGNTGTGVGLAVQSEWTQVPHLGAVRGSQSSQQNFLVGNLTAGSAPAPLPYAVIL